MKKNQFKRVNLWLDKSIYDKIKDKADKQYLRVGTYLRQIILQTIRNNNSNN
jgi:predicted DNA binding CopG/RHH family protein